MTLRIGPTRAYFRQSPKLLSRVRGLFPLFPFFYIAIAFADSSGASDKISQRSGELHGCFNKQLKAFPFGALSAQDASFQVTPVNRKT